MKRKFIALTAFLAVVLAGCGQIDEPTISLNDTKAKSSATQIEIQTEDATTMETSPVEKQNTTEATSTIIKAAESSCEQIITTDDNSEPQVLKSETGELGILQEATIQEVQVSENKNTSTINVEFVPSETTTAVLTQADIEVSEIFKMLNSLHYEPITCDGLPEYKLTADDGTVYWLNFGSKWVWKDGIDAEAVLPDDIIFWLKENIMEVNLEEAYL